jgi:hypothetical protein
MSATVTSRIKRCCDEPLNLRKYTAKTFRAACERLGIKQSMGRVGSALDNAVIESWHSTLEFELRALERFATKAQARASVAAWIDESRYAGDLVPGQWDRGGRVTASIGDRAWASSRCWFVSLGRVAVS